METSADASGGKREARATTPEPPRRPRSLFARLRRIAFHTAVLASVILLLAILILWPVSYLRSDLICYTTNDGSFETIASVAGRFDICGGHATGTTAGFGYAAPPQDFRTAWNRWSYRIHSSTVADACDYELLGCEYEAIVIAGTGQTNYAIVVPYSYLALLCAILPTFWLLTRNRRRRRDRLIAGLCPICGYDLRGHAALPNLRCPECGTPAPLAPPGTPIS